MLTKQNSPLIRKLSAFTNLSDTERSILGKFHKKRRVFTAGSDMLHEGEQHHSAYILSKGWVSSYKLLRDGTRQIVNFKIPGDFLGLRSVLLRTADHNIEPMTQVVATEFSAKELMSEFEKAPRLAAAILWSASCDDAIALERLISLGRRDANKRVAHFLLELGARLMNVGLGTKDGYQCPLTQYDLADALGLSAVHINRVLRKLREDGLLIFQQGEVTFLDFERLVLVAEFDMAYLDYEGPFLNLA
jgi:CRP-like cAMP-binding protein